jgi:curved DNA-binding protein CbpA
MDSSVKSRPNYYETLGLMPGASDDEIAQAFTKKMSISGMRPVGGAAQICAAYETLRNPAKRREHDRSLGLLPKTEARQWIVPSPKPRWEPFIASPPAAPLEQQLEIEEAPEPHVASSEPRAAVEPRTASFIAEALRELAKPAVHEGPSSSAVEPQEHRRPPIRPEASPETRPEASPETRPEASPEIGLGASPEPDIRQMLASRLVQEEAEAHFESRRFNWKRPAVALGGLVVAAGLVGTVAGLSLRDEVGSAQAEPTVTVAVPAATQHANTQTPPAAPVIASLGAQAQRASPTAVATPTRPAAQPRKATGFEGKAIQEAQAVEGAPVDTKPIEAAGDGAAAGQPAADAVAADLPLPSGVIARTIERIGYSCGEVTSTTAVDGAQGVFKVTCSSGASYRAAPVRGRYHFRRW